MTNDAQIVAQLKAQIEALQEQLIVLTGENYSGVCSSTDSEIDKSVEEKNKEIEGYLSDFTQREGILLMIAGLFSLLPLTNVESLRYFLWGTFPLLILAIFFYILSSRRFNFVPESDEEDYAEDSTTTLERHKLIKKSYFDALKWHTATDVALVSFFVSFVINYYWSVFFSIPTIGVGVLVYAVAVLAGFLRYFYIGSLKKNTPRKNEVLAVGSPGPLFDKSDSKNDDDEQE